MSSKISSAEIEELKKFKKSILFPYLPFISFNLEKLQSTPYEEKWSRLLGCIVDDKKIMTLEQILELKRAIINVQTKISNYQIIEKQKQKVKLVITNIGLTKPPQEITQLASAVPQEISDFDACFTTESDTNLLPPSMSPISLDRIYDDSHCIVTEIIKKLPEISAADKSKPAQFLNQLEESVGEERNLNTKKSQLVQKEAEAMEEPVNQERDPGISPLKRVGQLPVTKRVPLRRSSIFKPLLVTASKKVRGPKKLMHVLGIKGPRRCTVKQDNTYEEGKTESDEDYDDSIKAPTEPRVMLHKLDMQTVSPLIIKKISSKRSYEIKKHSKYESDEAVKPDLSHDFSRKDKDQDVPVLPVIPVKKPKLNAVEMPSTSKFKIPKISKISVDTSATAPPKFKIVSSFDYEFQDFTFIPCRFGYKFMCKLCSYESVEQEKFKQHIKSLHPLLLWSKYCSVCEEDIEGAGKNLVDEFNHMLKHMKE